MEKTITRAMKKFDGKSVNITQSGIIESKFYIKNLKYVIEESILEIDDGDDAYLDIDIDDIETLYFEFSANGYALLVLIIGIDVKIEIQVNDKNVIPIKDRICKWMENTEMTDEMYNKVCEA